MDTKPPWSPQSGGLQLKHPQPWQRISVSTSSPMQALNLLVLSLFVLNQANVCYRKLMQSSLLKSFPFYFSSPNEMPHSIKLWHRWQHHKHDTLPTPSSRLVRRSLSCVVIWTTKNLILLVILASLAQFCWCMRLSLYFLVFIFLPTAQTAEWKVCQANLRESRIHSVIEVGLGIFIHNI